MKVNLLQVHFYNSLLSIFKPKLMLDKRTAERDMSVCVYVCVYQTDLRNHSQVPKLGQQNLNWKHSQSIPITKEKNPNQILIIYNLFNKLMSFKIQCQSIMQLNMPAMFVTRHPCSRCIGGAPQLLVVPGINAWAVLVSALLHTQCRQFLHSSPSYPHPQNIHTSG